MREARAYDRMKTAILPRLREIDLVVFDFDGVMTDNRVLVMEDGREGAMCNRSDGLGIGLLRKSGVQAFVLSAEKVPIVARRCEKLDLEYVKGEQDKAGALREVLKRKRIKPGRVAYMGNDTNDLPCMEIVAVSIAPADSHTAVLARADAVTRLRGGHGAVREVVDWFLEARG